MLDLRYTRREFTEVVGLLQQWQQVLPENPRRVYVRIATNSPVDFWAGNKDQPNFDRGQRYSSPNYLELWYASHGSYVQSEWWIGDGSQARYYIVELIAEISIDRIFPETKPPAYLIHAGQTYRRASSESNILVPSNLKKH